MSLAERMKWAETDVVVSQCADCKHAAVDGAYCPAYPDGVPDVILTNRRKHGAILPGQEGGLVWMQTDGVTHALTSRRYAPMED